MTHDVEVTDGLRKAKQLAELELSLGFRSCSNFIPEGEYRVPDELLDLLTPNAFEVGIHDLKHNGQLFSSREAFVRSASRINSYLKEWGAVGFRSGFMLRNLDRLPDLGVYYDASTFGTDPFEPQADETGTIFPRQDGVT